jgi:hypothetical protein
MLGCTYLHIENESADDARLTKGHTQPQPHAARDCSYTISVVGCGLCVTYPCSRVAHVHDAAETVMLVTVTYVVVLNTCILLYRSLGLVARTPVADDWTWTGSRHS